jgi:Zn-dependent peptidase ImmA (M78 family)
MGAPIYPNAAQLLEELGITEPEELDIHAIAQYCKATIKYAALDGCAARIVGNEDRAIITIDSKSPVERQRFSAGHELGHWMFDRGKASMSSCEEKSFVKEWSKSNPETRANRYASDLLMPEAMFKKSANVLRRIDFNSVRSLAQVFKMSLTATAIRLVERGPLPAMLVCSSSVGVEWAAKGAETKRLFPQSPTPETYAHDILTGGDREASGDVAASAWFDHPLAERYDIHEHSIRGYADLVLSLLWWRNETMLIKLDEYEERRDARRSDDWRSR